MSVPLDMIVKPSIVLVLALAAMPLLRHRSAALRHAVLAVALLCAAAVPFAAPLVPAWHVPLIGVFGHQPAKTPGADVATNESVVVLHDRSDTPGSRRGAATSDVAPAALQSGLPARLLAWIWLIGAIPGIAILVAGVRHLGAIAATARRIDTGTWFTTATAIAREYGFTRGVTLLEARTSNLLVTWGIVRPTVLIPGAARDWPADRVAVVLAHELAHIRRGDWLVLLMAQVLRAFYWFNPLFWIAAALARHESERACDDHVLDRGVPGPEYATHLVGIARALRQEDSWLPAPAIIRTSSLEGRVKAMLDARLNRRPVTRTSGMLTLAALLSITVAVAGFAGAQTAFASLSGSIVDPQNAALPGVTLVLTNLQNESKYEVKSDRTGQYEFVGLPPGEYSASVKVPGFAAVQFPVTMAGQNVKRDLKLQIGIVEETITITARPSKPVESEMAFVSALTQERVAELAAKRAQACSNTPSESGVAIGGNIRPPMKLKDVRPDYPEPLKQAGIGGLVVLDANIGTDGSVTRVDVVSSPHPDLANAAADAVRQWLFDATLLNCVPIDVRMKVSVTFKQAS
jgi:TonB family protein